MSAIGGNAMLYLCMNGRLDNMFTNVLLNVLYINHRNLAVNNWLHFIYDMWLHGLLNNCLMSN